jgi:chemotaxis protein MotB
VSPPRNNPAVIVVRKKRAHHHGHHGGAWKVAYADFVTAMMAFFLVMWLVGQSQEVKASVAGYFRDPGVFEYAKSKGMLPGGTPGVEPGRAPQPIPPQDPSALEREGLRIELVERSGSSFFDSGSAVLRGESENILRVVAGELDQLPNDLMIEGHTDRQQFANAERYGNWELSADRANAARRAMEHAGLAPSRVQGVRGFADTHLHLEDNPLDPRNRRVSLVVRSHAAAQLEQSVTTGR